MTEAIINDFDEGFVIDTDAKAAWALRKIKEARDDRDTWIAWYESKIAEIKAQTDFNTMNLEHMLAEYFATLDRRKICVSRFNIMNSPTSPYFYFAEKK